jgi:hypothetical protein
MFRSIYYYAECHYAERRYAECRYAECRSACQMQNVLKRCKLMASDMGPYSKNLFPLYFRNGPTKLKCLCLQLSLMFSSKAGAYQSGTPCPSMDEVLMPKQVVSFLTPNINS